MLCVSCDSCKRLLLGGGLGLDPAEPLSFPVYVPGIPLSFWTQVRANLRESPCPSGSKGGPLTDNLLVVVVAVVVVGVVVAVMVVVAVVVVGVVVAVMVVVAVAVVGVETTYLT